MSNASDDEPSEQKSEKPPRHHWNATERFFDLRASHWVEIFLTIALLVVGAAQLVVYWRQAGIMKTQANIADVQNKITIEGQRAFVSIKELRVISDDPGGWIIEPIWENTGNTATRNFKSHLFPMHMLRIDQNAPVPLDKSGTVISGPDPPIDFTIPKDGRWTPTFIPPKGTGSTNRYFESKDMIQWVKDRKVIMYFWGVATYNDILPGTEEHITRFCYMTDAVIGDPMNVSRDLRIDFRQCAGNCTDSECKK